jgi:hypothetical protein
MKFFLTLLFIIPLHLCAAPSDISTDIAAAIRIGSARELSRFFGNSIDLTVGGKQEMYSKAQAEQVLRGFFAKHPPASFILRHKSGGTAANPYGIGTYVSIHKHKYRIYFLIRKIGNQQFIQQLSIEHET